VRLNFVFFTDSVSELYGQRMYFKLLCQNTRMFNKLLSFCKIHDLMGDYHWSYWAQASKNQATPLLPCVIRRLTYTAGRIRRFDGWRVAVVDRVGSCQATNRDVQNIAGLITPGEAPAWLSVFGQGSKKHKGKAKLSLSTPRRHMGKYGQSSIHSSPRP
jgi:hypothetical protein